MRSMIRRSIRAGTLALAVMAPIGAPVAAAPPSWEVQAPPFTSGRLELRAVDARSPTDAWAVGDVSDARGRQRPIAVRWNGSTWQEVAVPDPAPKGGSASLVDVAVLRSDLAWAVGNALTKRGVSRGYITRWNGSAWSRVPIPSIGTRSTLTGVAVVSTRLAWAVGWSVTKRGFERPRIQRRIGSAWSQVPAPPMPASKPGFASGGTLAAVDAIDATHAWAVGSHEQNYTGKRLVLRWDGRSWKRVGRPEKVLDSEGDFYDVSASGPSNVWIVGSKGWDAKTLMVRWNGRSWKQVATPSPGDEENLLTSVVARSPSDVLAVGYNDDDDYNTVNLGLRWDGSHLVRADPPSLFTDREDFANEVHGIGSGPGSPIWVVGWAGEADTRTYEGIIATCCP